jgi:hypothetical protein
MSVASDLKVASKEALNFGALSETTAKPKRQNGLHTVKDRKSNAGRKALYSEELAERFLDELASGKSLRRVCDQEGMPSILTVLKWERENETFAKRYAQARDDRGVAFGERIIDLVDDVIAADIPVDAARLAIDSLKWTAARLAPKVYGEKQTVDINQNINVAVEYASQLMRLADKGETAKVIEDISYTRKDKRK